MNGLQAGWQRIFGDPQGPAWVWCLKVLPLCTLPAMALAAGSLAVFKAWGVDLGKVQAPDRDPASWADWLGSVVLAPAVETLLQLGLMALLFRLTQRRGLVALGIALIAGLGHGSLGAAWFAPSAWAFFVLTHVAMAWWPRGFAMAFCTTASVHALNNMIAMTLVTLTA